MDPGSRVSSGTVVLLKKVGLIFRTVSGGLHRWNALRAPGKSDGRWRWTGSLHPSVKAWCWLSGDLLHSSALCLNFYAVQSFQNLLSLSHKISFMWSEFISWLLIVFLGVSSHIDWVFRLILSGKISFHLLVVCFPSFSVWPVHPLWLWSSCGHLYSGWAELDYAFWSLSLCGPRDAAKPGNRVSKVPDPLVVWGWICSFLAS